MGHGRCDVPRTIVAIVVDRHRLSMSNALVTLVLVQLGGIVKGFCIVARSHHLQPWIVVVFEQRIRVLRTLVFAHSQKTIDRHEGEDEREDERCQHNDQQGACLQRFACVEGERIKGKFLFGCGFKSSFQSFTYLLAVWTNNLVDCHSTRHRPGTLSSPCQRKCSPRPCNGRKRACPLWPPIDCR